MADKKSQRRFRLAGSIGAEALVVLAAVLLAWIVLSPSEIWSNDQATGVIDRLEKLAKALTPLAIAIGVYIGWRRTRATEEQVRISEEGQITDRFTKAIEQLGTSGEKELAIRLGGIYALARIARDSKNDHWAVMEVLTAYLRDKFPAREKIEANDDWSSECLALSPEAQAICTVLLQRQVRYEERGQSLDLSQTNLSAVRFRGGQLAKGKLEGTCLIHADMGDANLRGANLRDADLRGLNLWGADLEDADLRGATLDKANLGDANLTDANLMGAGLVGAELGGANLADVEFVGTDLCGADLLEVVNLRQEQVDEARGDRTTKLPPGLNRPPAWSV